MGLEQSKAKWSPAEDLKSLINNSNNREDNDSDAEKSPKSYKFTFKHSPKPANCICIKYNVISETSDEQHLRQLFPEKVWHRILKFCKGSSDLQNLSNASLFFRDILLTRRIEFLFPKVFEVLVQQYEQNTSDCFDMLKYQELEQPKYRPEYLRASEILWDFPGNYRLVCSAWNKAVEDYYGKLNEWQLKLKTDRKVRRRRIPMNHAIDSTTHSWFTQNFQRRNRNPFLHKSLSIIDTCSDIELSGLQEAYKNGTQTIIRKFGHHLNYIYITWTIQPNSNVSVVSQFLNQIFANQKINMLPNVKVLKLEHYFDLDNMASIEFHKELFSYSEQIYLTFPHLKFLSVKNLPPSIVNELLLQNQGTISQLEIESSIHPDDYNFFSIKLPNLKNLSIDLYSETGFKNMENYGRHWELSKFHCIRRGLNYIKLSRILQIVSSNWSTTLKDFYLELQNIDSEEEMRELSRSFDLNLPELERIAIKLSTGWCSLDFLLPLKKLKYIEIDSGLKRPWEKHSWDNGMSVLRKKERVKFIGYEDSMLKSNVWKRFPNLEYIVVQGKLFNKTR